MKGVGWDAETRRYERTFAGCIRSAPARVSRNGENHLHCCAEVCDQRPNETSYPKCNEDPDFDARRTREIPPTLKAAYCDGASLDGGSRKPGRGECCPNHCCFNDTTGTCIQKDIDLESCTPPAHSSQTTRPSSAAPTGAQNPGCDESL